MMRSKFTPWCAMALGLAMCSTAQAQTSREELARRELIERAEAAQTAGNHADAVRLGAQAAAIRQHPSLRLFLAGEYQQLNRFVEALAEARACVREAENDRSLRNRDRIRTACNEIATAAEPRIGRVQVQVQGTLPEGAEVHVGEEEVRASLLGAPLPVSPGELRVRVEAPGFEPFSVNVTVASQQTVVVPVRLVAVAAPVAPPVAPVTPVAPVAPVVAVTPPVMPVAPHTAPPPPESRGPGAGPWVLMGVGAASLIGGVVSFSASISAEESLSTSCVEGGTCTTEDDGHLSDIDTYDTVGALGLLVGVGALTGGIIWYAVAPRSTRSAQHGRNWNLGAGPIRRGVGLSYSLTF